MYYSIIDLGPTLEMVDGGCKSTHDVKKMPSLTKLVWLYSYFNFAGRCKSAGFGFSFSFTPTSSNRALLSSWEVFGAEAPEKGNQPLSPCYVLLTVCFGHNPDVITHNQ